MERLPELFLEKHLEKEGAEAAGVKREGVKREEAMRGLLPILERNLLVLRLVGGGMANMLRNLDLSEEDTDGPNEWLALEDDDPRNRSLLLFAILVRFILVLLLENVIEEGGGV